MIGADPTSEEWVAHQTTFMLTLLEQMFPEEAETGRMSGGTGSLYGAVADNRIRGAQPGEFVCGRS